MKNHVLGGLLAISFAFPAAASATEVVLTGKSSSTVTARVPERGLEISVTAPDWDLGNLSRGDSETKLTKESDKLCFVYNPYEPAIANNKFLISATSQNGEVGKRYRLKNTLDASQIVPYTLELDSGTGALLTLPGNTTAIAFKGMMTCFLATFKTTVGEGVKEGDYKDVLTFTIVTRS